MEFSQLLNPVEVVVQILNFLAVFFILRMVLWKKFLGILDARKQAVAESYQKVEQAQEDARRLNEDYQRKLMDIQEATRRKLQEAIVESEKVAQGIRHRAQEEANHIIENARKDIQYELSKAKTELRAQIVELAVGLTETALEENLTEEQDKRLTRSFLDKLDDVKV